MVEGLDALLTDQDAIGMIALRNSINEFISSEYGSGRLIVQEKIKPRVFRLHFELEAKALVLIIKCMEGRIGQRNELVARRWLPAVSLAEMGPPLLRTIGTADGIWVWHIYSDLGSCSLADNIENPECVTTAVRLLAEIHKRFIGHPYMAEFRLYGGDLGIPFVESNLRDATIALESIIKDHQVEENHWSVVSRLLERLSGITRELPFRLKMMKELAGPETLLHGDPWPINMFILPNGHARLIDWDRVAAGPLAYDLSTFILRFPPAQRFELINLYQEAIHTARWEIPAREYLNTIFETCEHARYVCLMIWPAIALWESGASWALEQLEEIERWFQAWEAVLPNV